MVNKYKKIVFNKPWLNSCLRPQSTERERFRLGRLGLKLGLRLLIRLRYLATDLLEMFGGELSYFLADSKLLFTQSLKGLMCSSFVNSTWFAMLCRICRITNKVKISIKVVENIHVDIQGHIAAYSNIFIAKY